MFDAVSRRHDADFPFPRRVAANVSDNNRSETAMPVNTGVEGEDRPRALRRTPRHSLIVVLPEHHVVSPDLLEDLRSRVDKDVDVLIACAGQPTDLGALQRSIGAAQFLLAPAGTSTEALRELAIRQAAGDIVRLLSAAQPERSQGAIELSMTS